MICTYAYNTCCSGDIAGRQWTDVDVVQRETYILGETSAELKLVMAQGLTGRLM